MCEGVHAPLEVWEARFRKAFAPAALTLPPPGDMGAAQVSHTVAVGLRLTNGEDEEFVKVGRLEEGLRPRAAVSGWVTRFQ